ncbi:type II secretion system F family protein [Saccharospirillum salsuginis]|uniref:Type II secretion system protein F n=1 Tax=Saccharospirillum salsuginis TaxID=418750 RepID=A0A918NI81_9GAMM|nr:type II secretion system F family protein [Saccharospirillum salsuginis]GGX69424.1 type II secretion system protein F [Saccharospirillum salsuginis]
MATKAQKMSIFNYEGLDRNGRVQKGEISGTNPALIKADLRRKGVIQVKKLTKKRADIQLFSQKVKPQDIAIFTRQMATMMKAGVPLMRAFDIVAEGLENQKMAELVTQMKNSVASGGSFGAALREHPKYFDDLYCSLIESGEQSGALETMLDRVALYKEKSESLKRKVKSAMKYPITVICVAFIVTVILLVKVVPTFAEMFTSFGADLPVPTQVVLNMSEWVQANGLLGAGILVAFGFGFQQSLQRSKKFRNGWQRFTVKLPVFGQILYQSAMARYARTLSTTFAAGVPLVSALESAAGASGNIIYENAILNVKRDVETGTELATSMRSQDVFPPMLVQMVAIGEQSGALDDMLGKAASIYEEEVDTLVDGLTAMMEPMIMAFLGVIVGGLVIAMYLPIFQMGSVV